MQLHFVYSECCLTNCGPHFPALRNTLVASLKKHSHMCLFFLCVTESVSLWAASRNAPASFCYLIAFVVLQSRHSCYRRLVRVLIFTCLLVCKDRQQSFSEKGQCFVPLSNWQAFLDDSSVEKGGLNLQYLEFFGQIVVFVRKIFESF